MVKQVLDHASVKSFYFTADGQLDTSGFWISTVWEQVRLAIKHQGITEALLCLDEIQKIPDWSEYVKREWDQDTLNNIPIRVILLGSSSVLIQEGLSESLAGRFESIPMSHWNFSEMKEAFGMTHDEFVFFGSYPGAYPLIKDEERWKLYVRESLVETALSKDIFLMTQIGKPALLRRMFEFSVFNSSEIISYTKMLGQLQDAGNTVTLAHYLTLLSAAGLSHGLEKYSPAKLRQRASSPKLQVYNAALSGCYSTLSFLESRTNPERWGRLVESAVGAHLLNSSVRNQFNVFYWRDRNYEVDFVLEKGNSIVALEIKSGRKKMITGLTEFRRRYPHARAFVIGTGGIPWQSFLETDPQVFFQIG
jgi:predicted AAA+ superfamily ATPase